MHIAPFQIIEKKRLKDLSTNETKNTTLTLTC